MSAHLGCPSRESLSALLSGKLPAGEADNLRRHLAQCSSCQQLAATLHPPATEILAPEGASADFTLPANTLVPLSPPVDATSPLVTGSTPAQPPASAEEGLDLSFLHPSHQPGSLGRLEHFEILELIGRGGMGVVLRARDTQVERIVAIKVMAPELAAGGTARQRFIREARTAAAVRHANVVAIHSVGENNRPPFLVMQFVPGLSLQQKLDSDGPPEVREVLRIGLEMAQGLAAAHKQGLIHRDVKPANILLEGSVAQVKITDFGLARAMDDASVTQSGVVAGTPMYMSPEQARGDPVDTRSDLFSLGSVLYFLCTGHPPFRAGNTMAVLRRVCEEAPRPIRAIRPEIPVWLANLIARLHAKDQASRVQTAREVADVLEQRLAFLHQGIAAPDELESTADVVPLRPGLPSPTGPAGPPAGRSAGKAWRRILVAFLAVLLLGASGLVSAYWFGFLTWPFQNDPGNPTTGETPWISLFNGKDLTGWATHPSQPGDWQVQNGILVGQGPKRSHLFTVRNDFENFHLRAEVRINPEGDSGLCFRCEFGAASGYGSPRGYEAQFIGDRHSTGIKTGSLCHFLNLEEQPVSTDVWRTYEIIARSNHLSILIDGTLVADYVDPNQSYSKGNLALQVFDPPTKIECRKIEIKRLGPADLLPGRTLADRKHEQIPEEELREAGLGDPARAPADLVAVGGSSRLKHWGQITSLDFSADGKQFVSAGSDGEVRICSSADGKLLQRLNGHVGNVSGLAVSRDGKVATGGQDRTVRLWDLVTGRELMRLPEHAAEVVRVVFSPDGKRLACAWLAPAQGDRAGKAGVKVWDVATGAEVWTADDWPGTPSAIHDLAWSPDGKMVAVAARTAGENSVIHLLGAADGKIVRDLDVMGIERRGRTLAFAPDSQRLAVLTSEGVDVCNVASGKSVLRIPLPRNEGQALAWSQDGKILITAERSSIRAWNPATANLVYEVKGGAVGAQAVALSPDGRVLVGAFGRSMVLWDGGSGERLHERRTSDYCNGVAFSPTGHLLAAATAGSTSLWLTAYDARQTVIGQYHHTVVFSKDGTMLATCGNDRKIKLFSPTGTLLRSLEGHTSDIWGLAFAPDNTRIASGGLDKTLRFWNARTGARLQTFAQPTAVECLAWSPDGKYLAGGRGPGFPNDGDLAIWSGSDGRSINIPARHGARIWWLAFSPNSKLLATAGFDGHIKLWDTTTWALARTLAVGQHTHSGGVSGVAFSPDGLTLVSRGRDDRIRVWDVGSGRLLREWTVPGMGYRVTFAPDGLHVATGNDNGTASVFRLPAHFRYESPKVVPLQDGLPFTAVPAGFLLPDVHGLWCLAMTPDGKTLAAGGSERVRLFERGDNTWQPGTILSGHTSHVRALTFSRDGQTLISSSEDRTIRVWHKQQGDWVAGRVLRGHALKVYGLVLAKDDRTLISVAGDWGSNRPGEIKRWDLTTGEPLLPVWGPQPATGAGVVVLSADGRTLAVGREDGIVEIWDQAAGKLLTTLAEFKGQVVALAISPDNSLLAAAGIGDNAIKLWQRQDNQWRFLRDLRTRGWMLQLRFDPTGTVLASSGYEELQLWHVPTFDELARLEGHMNRIDGLHFTSDGKTLLTASWDQSIRLWDIVPQKITAPQPFVLLARAGKAERRCFSLAGACALAEDGDTIEVRGNGPFETGPILVEGKAVVVRAGAGFRPVIVPRQDNHTYLLLCRSNLTLEGLEFRRTQEPAELWHLVALEGGSLHALHCRFLVQGQGNCLILNGTERGLFRNCEVLTSAWHGLIWMVAAQSRLEIDNSVFTAPLTVEVPRGQPRLEDVRLRMNRSTFASPAGSLHPHLLSFRLSSLPNLAKDGAFHVELEDSVLEFGNQMCLLQQWLPTAIKTTDVEKAYQQLLSWKVGKNAVVAGPPLVQFGVELRVSPDGTTLKNPAEWEQFWKLPKTETLTGPIRFTENLDRNKMAQTSPTAFKLHPESTGSKAGPLGKDLGADVEWLGPSAYERFRQSPAYKEWLKATGQVPEESVRERSDPTDATAGLAGERRHRTPT